MDISLKSLEEEAVRCIRCGACQNVCPVFKELQSESTVARGRVRLIRGVIENKLKITDGYIDRMFTCLMCKACVNNCPSGVKVDKLVEAARRDIVNVNRTSYLSKVIFRTVLKNRWIFNFSLQTGFHFQRFLFRKGPNGEGILPRIPLGLDYRRLLAPLASKTFRSMYPKVIKVPQARMKVVFFTGCMINYIYTDIGMAVIDVLKRNNVEVVIPPRQHCCGTPARINGEYGTAREMAKANIDVLDNEDCDAVLTACGTCGLALKEEYINLFADDPVYRDKAKNLGQKVKDFSELILELDNFKENLGNLPIKVTYHDPCHLVRGLNVREQPRIIMRSIPGLEFIEMTCPDACCGSGGSFSLKQYDLSVQINNRKVNDIKQTGADVLVTGCSACRMHIADGLYRKGIKAEVIHTSQLLKLAYEARDKQ